MTLWAQEIGGDDWVRRLSSWIPDQVCGGSSSHGLGLALRWAGSILPQVDLGMEVPSIFGPYCLSQGLFCHQHPAR